MAAVLPSSTTPSDLVVEAVRALSRAARLLEREAAELNLAHYRVLAAIAAGDQRASRIADKLALGKPTISASVEALSQRGLVQRAGVAGDQRAAALRLTRKGEDVLARADAAMARWLGAVLERTGRPGQVAGALVQMGDALEQMAAERHAVTGR